MSDILVEDLPDGIRVITLNRPEALNSFVQDMYDELASLFHDLKFDLSVRAVILTGAGKAFSAGHDVRTPSQAKRIDPSYGRFQKQSVSTSRFAALAPAMRNAPQPVIAAVKGAVAGLGYTLALAADMIVAGDSAKFVNAFHNAGFGAEGGLSYLLPRAVGAQRAAEILFSGRHVLADEAVRIGLALKKVPDDQLMEEAVALAKAFVVNSPLDMMLTKQTLWQNLNAPSLEAAIAHEHRGLIISQASDDAAEKRRSFIEKRSPNFKNT